MIRSFPISNGMEFLRRRAKWYLLCILLTSNFFIWYGVLAEERRGILKIAFLDIGQGDAIFIESPNGNQVLLDGGPNRKILQELGKVMPFYDRSVNTLIVSNPDKDHFAGFLDVLDSYHVDNVIEPGTKGASGLYLQLEEKIKEKNIPEILAKRGMDIDIGGGASIHIIFPDRDVSGLATNDGSIVARLQYGNTSVLLMGDSTQAIEKYLVPLDGAVLRSDILKVGHHGSRTSTSEELVGVVSPKIAVISDGKDNSYGHPHKETLDTLNKFGVEILRTDEKGTIICSSDGVSFMCDK